MISRDQFTRVSQTVLRGKVASAPRKNINNKTFLLHFDYNNFTCE